MPVWQRLIVLAVLVAVGFGSALRWRLDHEVGAAPNQPVQPPGQYRAVLTVLARGSDGTVGAELEVRIPFVPHVGMGIDLFVIRNVTWSTKRVAFIIDCGTLTQSDLKAREVMKLFANGTEWKENFFSEDANRR